VRSRKKARFRAIGLFIFLLALATSYYYNGIKNSKQTINSKEADRKYDQLDNSYKIQVDLATADMDGFKANLLKQTKDLGTIKLFSEEQSAYALYLIQYKSQYTNEMINLLGKLGKISRKIERVNTMGNIIDLQSKLNDKREMYDKAKQDYNTSKYRSYLRKQELDALRAEIDTLEYQLMNQKNREQSLIYIKAISSKATSSGMIRDYEKFGIDFVKWLVVYMAAIVLIYYGSILLVFLLSLVGIKLPNAPGYGGYGGYGSSKGYGGYSSSGSYSSYGAGRYGSYGKYSSDYNRRRRVKRVYRNKPSSSSGETPENEESKQ